MVDEDSLSVSSFFAEPPKQHKSFSLRKRKKESVDELATTHALFTVGADDEDVPNKRKKRLSKVASLANMLASPIRPLQNARQALKRSISGMLNHGTPDAGRSASQHIQDSPPLEEMPRSPMPTPVNRMQNSSANRLPSSQNLTPYRPPALTPTKHRIIHLWSETWGKQTAHSLTNQDVKRQEAIYELWQGECDLIEDISMLQRNYRDSLLRLGLLASEEAELIFGGLSRLLPVHQHLKERLAQARGRDGSVDCVALILQEWVPQLEVYVLHCANQLDAKSVLDEKRSCDARVQDFLTRCLESPFSRRLDVSSYLDVPRSRLVKYPLLLKQIIKYSENHPDHAVLQQVLATLCTILDRVDRATGLARCKSAIQQIDPGEQSGSSVLRRATCLICDGNLKTNHGIKLQCFLFDSGMVMTRTGTTGSRLTLYKSPLDVADHGFSVTDMGVKVGRNNSFLPHSSGSASVSQKHVFRVDTHRDSVTLVTFNEHNKKQWIIGLKRALDEWRLTNGGGGGAVSVGQGSADDSGRETSDPDSRCVPRIKASLNVRGTNNGRRRVLPSRGKIQVVSAPQLPLLQTQSSRQDHRLMKSSSSSGSQERINRTGSKTPASAASGTAATPSRFLRSKGSICLNQTLSPETHRICTRSCTSLKFAKLL